MLQVLSDAGMTPRDAGVIFREADHIARTITINEQNNVSDTDGSDSDEEIAEIIRRTDRTAERRINEQNNVSDTDGSDSDEEIA